MSPGQSGYNSHAESAFPMKIAILDSGSLVWDPRSLKDNLEDDGKFVQGGPKPPIEFSRISEDGRLQLVIDELHRTLVAHTRCHLSQLPVCPLRLGVTTLSKASS